MMVVGGGEGMKCISPPAGVAGGDTNAPSVSGESHPSGRTHLKHSAGSSPVINVYSSGAMHQAQRASNPLKMTGPPSPD